MTDRLVARLLALCLAQGKWSLADPCWPLRRQPHVAQAVRRQPDYGTLSRVR